MLIGKKIKTLREKKNISIEDFAKTLEFEPSVVEDWEADRSTPSLETKLKIANALSVPITELTEEQKNKKKKEPKTKTGAKHPFSGRDDKIQIIIGAILGLATIFIFFFVYAQKNYDLWPAIGMSIGAGYGICALIYCLFTDSFVLSMFLAISKWSIKFPGILFTLDLGGFAFLIVMKFIFWVIGAIIAICAFLLAVIISIIVSMFAFIPLVIVNTFD